MCEIVTSKLHFIIWSIENIYVETERHKHFNLAAAREKKCLEVIEPCSVCTSTDHVSANCPQASNKDTRGRKTRRSRSRNKQK
ncbi:hypothetical protein YC2023_088675 [Brassica napus]